MGIFSRGSSGEQDASATGAEGADGQQIPPADPPVSRSEFTDLNARLDRLADAMERNAGRPIVVEQQAPPPPPEPEITDEEINAAYAEGRGAEVTRRLLAQQERRMRADAQREIGSIRDYGTTMIGTLAERSFLASLDAEDKAIFSQYGDEVRAMVAGCDPGLRGHPDTWQTAFNAVTGTHRRELESARLDAELRRRDEEARAAAASAPQPGSGGRPRTAGLPDDDAVPTLHELAGEEFASQYLADMTEEDFIKRINRGKPARLRYKDWNDYVQRGRALDAELAAIRSGDVDESGRGAVPGSLR